MTTDELRKEFYRSFGFGAWPPFYEVDAETYGHVCQSIFDHALETQFPNVEEAEFCLKIAVGPNNGILFKGIELLLEGRKL